MKRQLLQLLEAVRLKDWVVATEHVGTLLTRKIEEGLVQEREVVSKGLVTEGWRTDDEDGTGGGPFGKPRQHMCAGCHGKWFGPANDTECPRCGKSEFDEATTGGKDAPTSFKAECMECGKIFITKKLVPSCPKCGGSDIDLA